MEKIILKCEVVTPLFLGNYNGKGVELRVPSIKGVLRFWWRSFHSNLSIGEMKEKESKIFGGHIGDNSLKSSFSMIIKSNSIETSKKNFPQEDYMLLSIPNKRFKLNILEYLAFGLKDFKSKQFREYIKPGSKFNIELYFYNNKVIEEVLISFWLLNYFGGLGAKSRNGFGCITINNIDSYIQMDLSKFKKYIQNNKLPSYTAFSESHWNYYESNNIFNNWYHALAELGKIYRSARLSLDRHYQYKNRKYIGTPLRGQIHPHGPSKNFLVGNIERHTKPYFLKVRKENNNYKISILSIKSKYAEGFLSSNNDSIYINVINNMNNNINRFLKKKF